MPEMSCKRSRILVTKLLLNVVQKLEKMEEYDPGTWSCETWYCLCQQVETAGAQKNV